MFAIFLYGIKDVKGYGMFAFLLNGILGMFAFLLHGI